MQFRGQKHRILAAIGVLSLGIATIAVLLFRQAAPSAATTYELPPIAPSPFLNASTSAGFVGMERCKSCHEAAHASYSATAHSLALATVDVAAEPPGGEFDDPRAKRHYAIKHQHAKLHHIESIRNASGKSVILADHPMRYVIGSGRFSRSYLIDRDGFLFESPATWYAARPGWSLSPGYDKSNAGFQRPVELRCLTCHAGRVESVNRSPQRVTLHTQSIDCERCHGPGRLHVDRHEKVDFNAQESDGQDMTIVNPSHLDRQRQEDICAQCHLHGSATIELRGRSLQDFRPGQLLTDFAVFYGSQDSGQQMEVVGHVEQMRLSRCYQASSMTCTTCHDPHDKPSAADAQSYYRAKCLTCHTEQSCAQPHAKRIQADPSDNCVACHMPRGPTEIPHFAFTHHRIGVHTPQKPSSVDDAARLLVPITQNTKLSEFDRERNLGLGYLQLSDGAGQARHAATYRDQALDILQRVHESRQNDPEVDAALARLYWEVDPQKTLKHAGRVIEAKSSSPDAWATACFTLGATYYNTDRPQEALPWLEKTVEVRPTADVWIMLSDCREYAGNLKGALDAAKQAVEMAPDRPRYLQRYAELLDRTGQPDRAVIQRKRMEDLQYYRSQVDGRSQTERVK